MLFIFIVFINFAHKKNLFLTVSYLFSTPINCFDLEFHKLFYLEKHFFHFFLTKIQEKLKKYSVTIIVTAFHCDFEFFQSTEARKSESQKHYKFLSFGLKFAKLFLNSLCLDSVP